MLKDKIRAAVNHPAAGFVTVLVLNAAVVVTSYAVSKKLEKKELELSTES
jgi:hypothetical protein